MTTLPRAPHLCLVRGQGWQPVKAREQPAAAGAESVGQRRSLHLSRSRWGGAQRKVRAVLVLQALLERVAHVVVQHLHERLARDGLRHGRGLRQRTRSARAVAGSLSGYGNMRTWLQAQLCPAPSATGFLPGLDSAPAAYAVRCVCRGSCSARDSASAGRRQRVLSSARTRIRRAERSQGSRSS